jgi:hypothetical protein
MSRNYERFRIAREVYGVQFPTSAYVASFSSRDTDSKILIPDTLLHAISQKEGSYTSGGVVHIGALMWHNDAGHQFAGAGLMKPRDLAKYIATREKSYALDPKHPDCQGYGPVGITSRSLQLQVEALPGGAMYPANHFIVCVNVFLGNIKWLQETEGPKTKVDPRNPDTWIAKCGQIWHSGRGGYLANGVGQYGEDLVAKNALWLGRLG